MTLNAAFFDSYPESFYLTVIYAGAQSPDPKVIEGAKKEGRWFSTRR